MNFTTYLQTVQLRAKPMAELADHSKHGGLGMFTELGEMADSVKRLWIYGKPWDRVNVLEECGDYLWYLVLYAWANGIGMLVLEAVVAKAKELHAKSPGGVLEADPVELVTTLMLPTASLASPVDSTLLDSSTRYELVSACLMVILAILWRHGFTLELCLAANNEKLEARTGKKFDATAILGRDTEAEQQILASHVTNGSDQAAG